MMRNHTVWFLVKCVEMYAMNFRGNIVDWSKLSNIFMYTYKAAGVKFNINSNNSFLCVQFFLHSSGVNTALLDFVREYPGELAPER